MSETPRTYKIVRLGQNRILDAAASVVGGSANISKLTNHGKSYMYDKVTIEMGPSNRSAVGLEVGGSSHFEGDTMDLDTIGKFHQTPILDNNVYLSANDTDDEAERIIGLSGSNNLHIGWDLYDRAKYNVYLSAGEDLVLRTSGLSYIMKNHANQSDYKDDGVYFRPRNRTVGKIKAGNDYSLQLFSYTSWISSLQSGADSSVIIESFKNDTYTQDARTAITYVSSSLNQKDNTCYSAQTSNSPNTMTYNLKTNDILSKLSSTNLIPDNETVGPLCTASGQYISYSLSSYRLISNVLPSGSFGMDDANQNIYNAAWVINTNKRIFELFLATSTDATGTEVSNLDLIPNSYVSGGQTITFPDIFKSKHVEMNSINPATVNWKETFEVNSSGIYGSLCGYILPYSSDDTKINTLTTGVYNAYTTRYGTGDLYTYSINADSPQFKTLDLLKAYYNLTTETLGSNYNTIPAYNPAIYTWSSDDNNSLVRRVIKDDSNNYTTIAGTNLNVGASWLVCASGSIGNNTVSDGDIWGITTPLIDGISNLDIKADTVATSIPASSFIRGAAWYNSSASEVSFNVTTTTYTYDSVLYYTASILLSETGKNINDEGVTSSTLTKTIRISSGKFLVAINSLIEYGYDDAYTGEYKAYMFFDPSLGDSENVNLGGGYDLFNTLNSSISLIANTNDTSLSNYLSKLQDCNIMYDNMILLKNRYKNPAGNPANGIMFGSSFIDVLSGTNTNYQTVDICNFYDSEIATLLTNSQIDYNHNSFNISKRIIGLSDETILTNSNRQDLAYNMWQFKEKFLTFLAKLQSLDMRYLYKNFIESYIIDDMPYDGKSTHRNFRAIAQVPLYFEPWTGSNNTTVQDTWDAKLSSHSDYLTNAYKIILGTNAKYFANVQAFVDGMPNDLYTSSNAAYPLACEISTPVSGHYSFSNITKSATSSTIVKVWDGLGPIDKFVCLFNQYSYSTATSKISGNSSMEDVAEYYELMYSFFRTRLDSISGFEDTNFISGYIDRPTTVLDIRPRDINYKAELDAAFTIYKSIFDINSRMSVPNATNGNGTVATYDLSTLPETNLHKNFAYMLWRNQEEFCLYCKFAIYNIEADLYTSYNRNGLYVDGRIVATNPYMYRVQPQYTVNGVSQAASNRGVAYVKMDGPSDPLLEKDGIVGSLPRYSFGTGGIYNTISIGSVNVDNEFNYVEDGFTRDIVLAAPPTLLQCVVPETDTTGRYNPDLYKTYDAGAYNLSIDSNKRIFKTSVLHRAYIAANTRLYGYVKPTYNCSQDPEMKGRTLISCSAPIKDTSNNGLPATDNADLYLYRYKKVVDSTTSYVIGQASPQTISALGNDVVVKKYITNITGTNTGLIGPVIIQRVCTGDIYSRIIIGNFSTGEIGGLTYTRRIDMAINPYIRQWSSGTGTACYITSSGQLVKNSSSIRYKNDRGFVSASSASRILGKLTAVKFTYKDDGDTNSLEYGYYAEDVDKIDKNLVAYNKDGSCESVKYQNIIPLLTEAYKEEKTKRESLERKLDEMEAKINEILEKLK